MSGCLVVILGEFALCQERVLVKNKNGLNFNYSPLLYIYNYLLLNQFFIIRFKWFPVNEVVQSKVAEIIEVAPVIL